MKTSERTVIPEDEIDLGEVANRMRNIFLYPLRMLVRNWKMSIVLCLIGVGIAVGLRQLLPKTYKATFVLRPTDVSDKIYTRVLNELPVLFRQKEYEVLAGLFQVQVSAIDKINSMKVMNYSYRVAADSTYFTEMIIEGTDPGQFTKLQNGVLRYLESSAYYRLIKDLQKRQIELSLEEINRDMPRLDSLKRLQLDALTRNESSGINALSASLFNPAAVYTVSIDRVDRKSRLLAQSAFLNRFQLVKACVAPRHASFPPRILVLCLFTVPAVLILYLLFLHFSTFRRQPSIHQS